MGKQLQGRSVVTGARQGRPSAAPCSALLDLAQTLRCAAAGMCEEEGGREAGEARGMPRGMRWGVGARATRCCDSRVCTELAVTPTTLSPSQGSPRAGPCPCSRQAGKASRLLHALSIPMANCPALVTPFPAALPNSSLPAAPPALPQLHLPRETLAAFLPFPHPP